MYCRKTEALRLPVIFLLCFIALDLKAVDYSDLVGKLQEKGIQFERGSIFVHGDPNLDPLIPIRVLGAVPKAGVHYIPAGTDLLTLVTLVGGTTEKADLSDVIIKRGAKKSEQVIRLDLEEHIEATGNLEITLEANDMIHIPMKKRVLSDELIRIIGFVAGLATIFGTVVVGVNNL